MENFQGSWGRGMNNLNKKPSKARVTLAVSLVIGIIGTSSYLKSKGHANSYYSSHSSQSHRHQHFHRHHRYHPYQSHYNKYRRTHRHGASLRGWRWHGPRTAWPWVFIPDQSYYYIKPADYHQAHYWKFANKSSTDVVIATQTAQLLLPAGQKVWVRITPRGLFSIKDKNTKKMQTYTSQAPLITIQRDFDSGELFIQPYKTVKNMN